jgi:signal transduction histidine kinase
MKAGWKRANPSRVRASRSATGSVSHLSLGASLDNRKSFEPIRQGSPQRRSKHSGDSTKGGDQLKHEIKRRKAGQLTIQESKIEFHNLVLESEVMQEKLRHLTRQLISAQEDERREISRELHDGAVQKLVSINIELSALRAETPEGAPILKAGIARIQKMVSKSVKSLHRFAHDLRPAILDDLGLIPALYAYSKGLAARKKIKIQLTAFDGVEALVNAKRTVMFRVAQEALTNIARHAYATKVGLSIIKIPGAIRMEISDNGKSFHVGNALLAKNPKRLGLIGMKERVEMIGGRLTIESSPGKGTTVRADIPLDQSDRGTK